MARTKKKTKVAEPVSAPLRTAPTGAETPPPPPAVKYLDYIVLAALAIVFAIQFHLAATTYLNADEALIMHSARQDSMMDAYRANFGNAHPPLVVVVLYFANLISSSEWFLRLLPLACYGMMAWFGYKWGRLALGQVGAVCIAALLALTPPLFDLAREMRQYIPAFGFAMASLYFLASAVKENSARRMGWSFAMMALALLSHYSIIWLLAGYGLYGIGLLLPKETPIRIRAAWAGGMLLLAGLLAYLYVTHISQLNGTDMATEARTGWLRAVYVQPDQDAVDFLFSNTQKLFQYLYSSTVAAWVGAIATIIGIFFLATAKVGSRAVALLVTAPFVIWCGAAAAGAYPYGGTRHSALLGLLTAIAIGAAVEKLSRGKLLWAAPGLAVFLILANRAPGADVQVMSAKMQQRSYAVDAVAYLRSQVSPGAIVFADQQASVLLYHYYNPKHVYRRKWGKSFWEDNVDGLKIVVCPKWTLDPNDFVAELRKLKEEYQLKPGAEVWVFDGGWGSPISAMLAVQFGGTAAWPGLREFGPNFSVFRVPN